MSFSEPVISTLNEFISRQIRKSRMKIVVWENVCKKSLFEGESGKRMRFGRNPDVCAIVPIHQKRAMKVCGKHSVLLFV